MALDQANPLRAAGIDLTEDVITKNRWYAFWDAPLVMPGGPEMQDEAARGDRAPATLAAAARVRKHRRLFALHC